MPTEIVDAAGAWGWTAATLGAAAAMALTTQRLAARTERAYRQPLLAALLPAWAACLGAAAGVAVHLVRLRLAPAAPYGTSFLVPLLLLGAAAAGVVLLGAWLAVAVPRARRRARMIVRVRATGIRHRGEVAELHWPRVVVAFDGRRVHARLARDGRLIPIAGHPVVVIVGDDGEVLVEHDPSRPPRYHPAPDRFVGAAGG